MQELCQYISVYLVRSRHLNEWSGCFRGFGTELAQLNRVRQEHAASRMQSREVMQVPVSPESMPSVTSDMSLFIAVKLE